MFGFSKKKKQAKIAAEASHPPLPPEALSRYEPFKDLEETHVALLHSFIDEKWAQDGDQIIQLGGEDNFSYFLLKGKLKMTSHDDRVKVIDENADTARFPISDLRPHRYNISAQGPVHYFVLDNSVLRVLIETKNKGTLENEDDGMVVNLPGTASQTADFLMGEILDDLSKDQLTLPSLPTVALDISRALHDQETDAGKITDIIQTDPAIAAKIVRAANSALYAGQGKVEDCHNAVVRLGFEVINRLVISFALQEVFLARNLALKQWMDDLWHHSLEIAALCHTLAQGRKGLNPENAMLAGLLHDIGVLTVLGYADRVVDISVSLEEMKEIAAKIRGQVGAKVLEAWKFEPSLIIACRHAENWHFQREKMVSYPDLVIAAQRLNLLDKDPKAPIPDIAEMPVFYRLFINGLDEEEQQALIAKGKEKLAQLHGLFARK